VVQVLGSVGALPEIFTEIEACRTTGPKW